MSKTFRSEKKFHVSICRAPGVIHIAGHFTIAGKESLTVHAKWIGRCGQPGAKVKHGTVQSIRAM
jgi:hypothetical protein